MNIYRQRMENVVRALAEIPPHGTFKMDNFGAPLQTRMGPGSGPLWQGECGTPWCCLGHYATRSDLQSEFTLNRYGHLLFGEIMVGLNDDPVIEHFGIDYMEAVELFGAHGCGEAKTPADAIAYLRGFIARKWPAPEMAKLKAELEAV